MHPVGAVKLKLELPIFTPLPACNDYLIGIFDFTESMIQEDRILQAMPNIVMALHVLCEKMASNSFWKPYLSILDM